MSEVNPSVKAGRGQAQSTSLPVGRALRFIATFGLLFVTLLWLFDGAGPIRAVNQWIMAFTRFQTRVAAGLLRGLGDTVTVSGSTLIGPAFSCEVDTGCNGMSALILLAAGILAFPATWRIRGLGLVLLPGIVLINIFRLAALHSIGSHLPSWFGPAHVYGGQVVVIVLTVALWFVWMTWTFRSPAGSS